MSGEDRSDACALVRRLLLQAQAKSADFASHLHPHWVNAAWQRVGLDVGLHAARIPGERHGRLLFTAYGLGWPSLADLRRRNHRICILERRSILRLLAVCALVPRRDGVRRSIARDVRRSLVDNIGEPAYEMLLRSPTSGQPDMPALDAADIELEALATAGYAALCVPGAWLCREALAITRLSLPPETAAPSPSDDAARTASDVIEHLQDYFPEHAWLFGSDMDRALSASKTASCEPLTSPA